MHVTNIKYYLKKILQYLPDNGRWLKKNFHTSRLIQRKLQVKLKNIVLDAEIPNPEIVYWINPNRIVFHTNYQNRNQSLDFDARIFDTLKDKGKVYGGDWDKSTYKFSDLYIYKAIEERIKNNTAWKDTAFYKSNLSKINDPNIKILWNCKTQDDLDNRCRYIDDLIASIKAFGFKENYQVKLEGEEYCLEKSPEFSDEITVNIGRDGQYLFQNSRHRLAIAKILGIETVPVKVHVRHEQWMELRRILNVMAEGNPRDKGYLRQPAIHPDLMDIPAKHNSEKQFAEISKYLCRPYGNMLDLRSDLGYFCHRFEDLGFKCYGVEHSPDIVNAAKKLQISEEKQFKLFAGDITDLCVKPPLKYIHFDVVLALNIFHHFLKTEKKYAQLIKLLQTLDMKEMYFETHAFNEPHMKNAFVNYHEEEFVNFILSNSSLKKASPIHISNDQNTIYKLEY